MMYCCEDISKIENYDKAVNDEIQIWDCHHRLETHNSDGERRPIDLSMKELEVLGMYYNRPADELVFLAHAEHMSLHHKGKPKSEEYRKEKSEAYKGRKFGHCSEETRKKLSEAMKGNKIWEGRHHSEETRKKISEAKKGKPSNAKGRHWKLVDGKRVYY